MCELSVKGQLARFAHGRADVGGVMQPDQLTAQLLAELLGIGALGLAILWQPRHRCRWEHCPHHGKTVREEIRLDRELHDREDR